MAEFELGRAFITDNSVVPLTEEFHFIHYEDSTNKFVVRDDIGAIQTTGSVITDSLDVNRIDNGFSTTINTLGVYYLVTFSEIDSFPYFTKHLTETTPPDEPTGDVRDISLRFVSMIMPTEGNSDGEITIEASGTNTPFKYYTTDPKDFVNDNSLDTGQDTGEFTGLGQGTYTFYAAGMGANNPRLDSTSIQLL